MPLLPRTHFAWQLRTRSLTLGERTRVMGILNVTPDSFSDGGRFTSPDAALAQALAMIDHGADILDIGGESTRPGATPLSAEDEQARVLPIIAAVLQHRPGTIISIDTYHPATARAAVQAGAEIVNDVSGLTWGVPNKSNDKSDDKSGDMAAVCANLACGLVLMHTRGRPGEWSTLPPIPPLARMPVVLTGLRDSILTARKAGVASDRIVLDPGLGFGKLGEENYTLLALLHQMLQFGLPLLCGASRKGFLGATLSEFHGGRPAPVADRGNATTAANVAAVLAGAHLLRVHDVRSAVEAAAVADAILHAAEELAAKTGPAWTPTASNAVQ